MLTRFLGKVKVDDIPPSVNHYWAAKGNRRFITKRGKEFKKLLSTHASFFKKRKTNGDVYLEIEVCLPDRRRRDVDNFLKPILDSLEGIVYEDDSQVRGLYIAKIFKRNQKYTVVRVFECLR